MAMGKPVIATLTPGLADYVCPDTTVRCVPPGDGQALSDALGSLWEHVARRRELGANARQFVVEHATLDRHVAELAAIVRDVERYGPGGSVDRSDATGSPLIPGQHVR
jgi:glycosyltransferase involved in cell wall biosynthesis